jgi:hypothetical protein
MPWIKRKLWLIMSYYYRICNNQSMKETISKIFIEQIIDNDIEEGRCNAVMTRFPPEPNGYVQIGHAKSILFNNRLAKKYGGEFEDRLFFATDYFKQNSAQGHRVFNRNVSLKSS